MTTIGIVLEIGQVSAIEKEPSNILVIGGNGGLGSALVDSALQRFPKATISATYYQSKPNVEHERLLWQHLDVRDCGGIEEIANNFDRLDWLVNCVGLLHDVGNGPEKTIRSIDAQFFMSNISINTLPTLMLAKYFSSALSKSPSPTFATISARVGSIEDNRLGGWYSYRMSKAALNMSLKTLSIEWSRTHPNGCVVALHPGTNDTRLSKPFQTNVPPNNLFEPSDTALKLIELLEQLGPNQSGKFWAWDGSNIAW